MIIKNNLDVDLSLDGSDVLISPYCEYTCDPPISGKMKLRCVYGFVTIIFDADSEPGIDITCSGYKLFAIYKFDKMPTTLTKIDIYRQVIFN